MAFFPRIYEASGYPDLTNHTTHRGKPFDQPVGWLKYQASARGFGASGGIQPLGLAFSVRWGSVCTNTP